MAQPIDRKCFPDRHFWHVGYDKASTAAEPTARTLAKLVAVGTPAPTAQLLANVLDQQHHRTLAFINHHRNAMLQAITVARNSNGAQTFTTQMKALRDQTKADRDALIDAIFARLTNIGAAHPDSRLVVLNTANKIVKFTTDILGATTNVMATVMSAVTASGSAIDEAAEVIKNAAS